jgi:AraC family transcriptional regulator of arabinose operon
MDDRLNLLLSNAELKVGTFDIQARRELQTFKRSIPFCIMSYHKKGRAMLRIGGQIHTIEPGTVVYIPPNVEHDHYKTTNEETVFLWWHFTYQIADMVDVLNLFQIPYTFKLKNSEHFEQVFLQFMESTKQSHPLPSTILKQAKALEMLYILLNNTISENDTFIDAPADSFLSILAKIVQYPERPLSLQMLSQELHMHPTYICNRFKELFGKSPIQTQKELKIGKAKTLLMTTEMSITEISEALGFTEIQNFTRLFKTYTSVSPLQYRTFYNKTEKPNLLLHGGNLV